MEPPDVVFAPLDARVHDTEELGVAVMAIVFVSVASIVCVDADAGIANAPIVSAMMPAATSFFIERVLLGPPASLGGVFIRFGLGPVRLDS
jgi:hypothetical protein